MSAKYPPAIVWGVESQIGLGIVRELGEFGIPIIVLTESFSAIGAASRFVSEVVIAEERGPRLLEQLREIGVTRGARALFAVSEGNCRFLAEHRDAIQPVVALVPERRALDVVLDKEATLHVARLHGIEVPRSVAITSSEEIDAVAATFPLPAVIKWRNPLQIVGRLKSAGLEYSKAEYVYMPGELATALHRFDRIGAWPTVQEYCPGYGLGLFFFMSGGIARRRFQHERVAEWPPEGGFSSVCQAVPLTLHADLQERCVEMLREIGWDGVAMVEFRFDPNTRRAVLMEINGRYWGSFPLAVHCRAGFALYSYFEHALRQQFDLPEPRGDLRARMVATELKRLARILFQPEAIMDRAFVRRPFFEVARFMFDFVRPGTRYYVFRADDPWPLARDMLNLLRKGVARGRRA